MHRWILGAAIWLTALGGTWAADAAKVASTNPALPRCPAPGAEVLERFMSADCTGCWSATDAAHAPARAWLFDWIAPSAQGADAPMSAAALTASDERALRAGSPGPAVAAAATATQLVRTQLPSRTAVQLQVQSGPAWNGYFGLQMTIRGHAPAGAMAWMALVEPLPAGTDGTGTARELMRSVAGPLPVSLTTGRAPLTHLVALRAPDSARPERLRARAWIEGPDGRILAVASDACTALTH